MDGILLLLGVIATIIAVDRIILRDWLTAALCVGLALLTLVILRITKRDEERLVRSYHGKRQSPVRARHHKK